MPTTQLADIYNPLVFEAAVDEALIETNAFIQSGVLVSSPILNSMASVGGNIGELPFHHNLDVSGEPNYSNDNPATLATPDKITTGKMIYMLASMNNAWATMDLARELALMDPLSAITGKIGDYWSTQMNKRVIASTEGIITDSVADHASDMVVDIHVDSLTVAATNIISAEAILEVDQTMGDKMGELVVIAMHSRTFTNLRIQNLIDYIPNARGEVMFPTYLGKAVVVDDALTVKTVTGTWYYTYLYARGAFDHGSGKIMNASELERQPATGNGGGQDIIYSRRSDIIHPYGYQFDATAPAGQSADLSELAADNWTRVVDRKNVQVACLIHNN